MGVKPYHITVIGTSMGGYIAIKVSNNIKYKEVKYVFVGCCTNEDDNSQHSQTLYGNILSIYEDSDTIGSSCKNLIDKSISTTKFREVKINTGMKHGFLFKALPEWLEPTINWIRNTNKK